VENYFTDFLLYKENRKVAKELLPDDIDSGNEADSESGDDLVVSFDEEPLVAYFDNSDCNNSAENDGEWFLNKNINFDYSSCLDDVNSPVDMNPLYMFLPMLTACMQVEDNDGSAFVVPSLKKDQ